MDDSLLERLVMKAKTDTNESGKAFDKILQMLYPEIRRLTSRYYISGSDSEDVLQEARIGIWKAVEDWMPEGGTQGRMSFRNFALNICCRRHVVTAMASANRKKYSPLNNSISYNTPITTTESDTEQSLADFIEDPTSKILENYIHNEEYEENNQEILRKLTKLEKDIYLLFVENYSYKEIALILHIKTKAVDNALMRIRKKASEIIPEEDELYDN